MMLTSLSFSIDSLVVAAALSRVLGLRHALPLALMFGICDAGASLLGQRLGLQIPSPGLAAAALLAAWAALATLDRPFVGRWLRSPVWAYALAPLMAVDNLAAPGSVLGLGLASAGLAAVGFAVGALVFRGPGRRSPDRVLMWAPLGLAVLMLSA